MQRNHTIVNLPRYLFYKLHILFKELHHQIPKIPYTTKMVNNSSKSGKGTSALHEGLSGSSSSLSPQVGPVSPSSGRILGQDLTHQGDVRDGVRTPLGWKEAKRAADSKIITEMPEFKK
ncbi:hypothetical protein TWF506_002672 [Arthrobotrys conoides]|uniref:Uncharacterized protein n=1 Tax=Arthrobotrys conoides TaxID=74498 RepID=A0AAN8RV05_9PEZI